MHKTARQMWFLPESAIRHRHPRGLNDHLAVAPAPPPPRQQQPKETIPQAEAWTARTAALEHRDLMAQRDHFQDQRNRRWRLATGDRAGS